MIRTRRARLLLFLALQLAAVLGAALFLFLDRYAVFDYILICPFHLLGLYCPTCGMTRAAHSLLALDLAAALRYHPLILLLAATLLYYDGALLLSALRKRPPARPVSRLPLYLTVAAFLVFFLLRNLLLLAFGIDPVGDFL